MQPNMTSANELRSYSEKMYSVLEKEPGSISSILGNARKNILREYKISKSKIQTVPPHLREGDKYAKYYRPKFISIGPIHHGDPNLKQGEQYKLMWTGMYAVQNKQDPEVLHKRVLNNIAMLRELFSWDKIGIANDCYNDEELAFMLFVDGCSVIQILEKAILFAPAELNVKVDQMILLQRDILLLENQLPYEVLKLLVDDEMKLKIFMRIFCMLHNMFTALGSTNSSCFKEPALQKIIKNESRSPIHLLDYLRTVILSCGIHDETYEQEIEYEDMKPAVSDALGPEYVYMGFLFLNEEQTTYRTTQELKAAAIRIKRQENANLNMITFSSSFFGGKLYLPPLILNVSSVPILLNLVTYEMCPGFLNRFEISSYVKLLDMLIDHPEDVKELREVGVLQNSLGSDKEVSELFNAIGPGLVQNQLLYSRIKSKMEKHHKKRLGIWISEAYYTHFRSPWTIITLLATTILLILTFIQTWNSFLSR